ncbi:hypothetical protein B0H10DRAFT_1077646 [Mycena sp. CBHHK59/15]|nr:hypothetical protein B0H10DRAFT_1077646 [Mycena sp. CBHHK59/15]
MPPGPVFNWLCVASSACDILVRVARLRASQVASDVPLVNTIKCTAKNEFKTSPGASATLDRRGVDTWRPGSTENQASTPSEPLGASAKLKAEFPLQDVDGASRGAAMTLERRGADTWRAGSTGNQVGYLNEPLDVSASTAEFLLQDVDQSSKTPSGPSAAVYRHAADELHHVPVENTQKSLDITQGPSSQDHTSTEDTPSAYEPHTHLVQSEVPVAADNFPVDSDESHRSADVSEVNTIQHRVFL